MFIIFPPENPNHVPHVVRGLTIIAGMLVTATIFILSYMGTKSKDKKFRKWLQNRIFLAIIVFSFGFFLIMISYEELMNDRLVSSILSANIGLGTMFLLFIRTAILVTVEEEDLN